MKNINYKSLSDEKFWKRLGLVLSIVACFTFFGCRELLPVPQMTQTSDILLNGKTIAAPLNVTASHGQKKQITVSWTPVSNAKYYFIYRADTPYSDFVQIDEATGDTSSKSVSVPAGYSGYFKVAAVTGLGEISELSLASYGTSLATPIITDIIQDDAESTAEVYWYMENLSEKSYLSSIQFEVRCLNADGTEKDHKLISATDNTTCKFENLNTATLYRYEVEAYLRSDQNASEKSAQVDRLTAVSLIPQIANFTATEGTEKEKKVTLTITLPQMAKTLSATGTSGADISDYEDRPIFFKIERFNETNNTYEIIVPYLSFNGYTTELAKDAADFALYEEGKTVTWSDTNVERGIKYKYRVLSYVDNYFDKDNPSKRNSVTHAANKANVQTGWVANVPAITSTPVEYFTATAVNADDDSISKDYVKSASLKLSASWEALGKESDYSYLLVEKHLMIKKDNGNTEDTTGTSKIIRASAENAYFDSISKIKDYVINYEFEAQSVDADGNLIDVEANKAIRGYYEYSIYIIPDAVAQANSNPDTSIISDALTSADDSSRRLVINEQVEMPVLTVNDGYKNKAVISYNKADGATYKLVRQTLDESGKIVAGEDKSFDVTDSKDYTDSTLESGKAYQYTLYCTTSTMDDVPSSTLRAYTLGKPNLTFDTEKLDYSTITVKWSSVIHPLEMADITEDENKDKNVKYTVIVNNIPYEFLHSDFKGTTNETVEDPEKRYTLTVINGTDYIFKLKKNIPNFTYPSGKAPQIAANKAGDNFDVTLKVTNKITDADNYNSKIVQARTLGPAKTNIDATHATDVNNITVHWDTIPGVDYYAVRRICPATTAEEEDKIDVIYIAKDGTVTQNGEAVSRDRSAVALNGTRFTLTDQHCTANDATNSYQVTQSKIAWGLEYKYTVTPVLSTDDNPFEDFDKVTYTNDSDTTVTATGYTPGYGLNVVASKADYADSVTLTWDKPNGFVNSAPSLWYRKEGTKEWIYSGTYKAGDTKATIYLDDPEDPENRALTLRDKRVEFAITYENNRAVKWQPSYLSYLESKKDKDQEQLNMGYQFSLITFNTTAPLSTAETFSETINWSADQNGNRKKGVGDGIDGDCYEIQVLNKNCSDKWYTIATVAKDGTVTQVNKDWYDIKWNYNGNNSLTITALNSTTKAEFTTSKRLTRGSTMADAITGEHDGLLKVQRDYKHYYRLVAKRVNSSGTTIQATLGDINNSQLHDNTAKEAVYSYRKISDDEFVKGITLIVADALNQTGIKDGGTRTIGNFYVGRQGGTRTFWYGTNNPHTHSFSAGTPFSDSTPLSSGWTISIAEAKEGDSAQGTTVANLPWGTIVATHESNLPSYSGCVLLHAGDKNIGTFGGITKKYDLCIQYSHKSDASNDKDKIVIATAFPNDTTYNSSKRDTIYTANNNSSMFWAWFPYTIDESHSDQITSFDANQPCYKNLWWEVRD